MIPLRPLLPRPPWDIPDDEPTEDEDWAHEETEAEYCRERNIEDGIWRA